MLGSSLVVFACAASAPGRDVASPHPALSAPNPSTVASVPAKPDGAAPPPEDVEKSNPQRPPADARNSESKKGDKKGEEDPFVSLGLTGIGEGKGGRGEGICLCGRDVDGAQGTRRTRGSRRDSRTISPRIRMGEIAVRGKLPPEVVQRVVRQELGRFRMCYEHALSAKPRLAGVVRIAFAIDAAGAVAQASDNGSTLADADVIACAVKAVAGLKFPSPESGEVRVVGSWKFEVPDEP